MRADFSEIGIRKIYTAYSREEGNVVFSKTSLRFPTDFEVKGMLETDFQKDLVEEIKERFPGAIVYKNEPTVSFQGIPDLTVLYGNKWAWLECKASEKDRRKPRPNQERYVAQGDSMSFARFIYPENKQEVLNELQQAFGTGRETRDPESE